MKRVEYPYRLNIFGIWLMLFVAAGVAGAVYLMPEIMAVLFEDSTPVEDAKGIMLLAFVALGIIEVVAAPIVIYRGRHLMLRLTESELSVGQIFGGPATVELRDIKNIQIVGAWKSRNILLEAGNRKVLISELLLPSAEAFDQILQILTAQKALNDRGELSRAV
jgi:hypothetical protein